jgi:arginyl-tRNA synthetase
MTTIIAQLRNQFKKAVDAAFPELAKDGALLVDLTQSTNEKFGHYQCNSAMKIGKLLKKNPREAAKEIVEKMDVTDLIEKIEIEGPGFINITLSASFLNQVVQSMLDDHLGVLPHSHPNRIVIDFSSPNTAKEMHVGHLRSTIIGDSLARVFEFLGDDVLRLNHIGDWGTAFGMLIAYIKRHHPHVIDAKEPASLTDLVTWYKLSKAEFDQDPEFKKTAQEAVVALQGGDPDSLKAWNVICTISSKAYQEIYDLLDIKLTERGESYYNPLLAETVADLESKGLVTLSDGAKCIFLEGFKNREGTSLPLMVQKSDGGYNYDTTDMAAIRHRIDVEKADRLIYVTDQGQSTHFQMIFQAAEKAGYLDKNKVRVDHVGFGMVLGQDGKKFRTRSGDTEKLVDLLTAAITQADTILKERSPELSESDRLHAAKILGLGAIKYADLSSNRMSDYVFSYDKMLRFEGNTAAFILYSYVRVGGIKRKIGVEVDQTSAKIALVHPSEIALGLHLGQFQEALEAVAEELLPNRLTDYLYTLAEKFNAFFRDCRVEGTPEQGSRLLLAEATARTLKTGLNLLGIQTLETM